MLAMALPGMQELVEIRRLHYLLPLLLGGSLAGLTIVQDALDRIGVPG